MGERNSPAAKQCRARGLRPSPDHPLPQPVHGPAPHHVVNTGTPAGVALGMPDPDPYLRSGDVVELDINGLGRQRQEVKPS
ncbi:fumarylacetoacetate hydrolase family protein [Actinoplanes sp. CA-030573]|uniref:fumarylacetoacetate hydrolase family protein n=1 Tax=Actinoplanes sp. CA-030573 TaxID=3239898 RepID=UPI003D8A6629